MLAPLPATVQVPDDADALPTTPVLPTSRLAQPVGNADCARTTLALTASAHTNPTADRAPPRICLFVKMRLPVICRAPLVRGAHHVSPSRDRRVALPNCPLLFVSLQADSLARALPPRHRCEKNQYLPRCDPVELGLNAGLNGSRHEQQLHERPWAQEIITAA